MDIRRAVGKYTGPAVFLLAVFQIVNLDPQNPGQTYELAQELERQACDKDGVPQWLPCATGFCLYCVNPTTGAVVSMPSVLPPCHTGGLSIEAFMGMEDEVVVQRRRICMAQLVNKKNN